MTKKGTGLILSGGASRGGGAASSVRHDVTDMAMGLSGALDGLISKTALFESATQVAGSAVQTFTNQLADVDKIHKLNLRLGASTEALSEYAYVAKLAGTDIESLAQGWHNQSVRIAEAAKGTGAAQEALAALKLDAGELNTLKPEDQFLRIAQALQGVASNGERMQLVADIYGQLGDPKVAAAILQVANQGTAAIQQQMQAAKALGVTISQDQANAIAGLNDSVTNLTVAYEGLHRKAGLFVANQFTDDINELAQVVSGNTSAWDAYGAEMVVVSGIALSQLAPALQKKVTQILAVERATIAEAGAARNAAAADAGRKRELLEVAQAERRLAEHQYRTAKSARERSAANTELARTTQNVRAAERKKAKATESLVSATQRYNRFTTVAGRLAFGLRGALALFGGPVGVAMLAATAIGTLATRSDNAKTSMQILREEIDQMRSSMAELSIFESNEYVSKLYDARASKDQEIAAAQQRLKNLEKNGAQKFASKGGVGVYDNVVSSTKSGIENLQKERAELDKAYTEANDTLEEAMRRHAAQREEEIARVQELVNQQRELLGSYDAESGSLHELMLIKSTLLDLKGQEPSLDKAIEDQLKKVNRLIKENNADLKGNLDCRNNIELVRKTSLAQMQEELVARQKEAAARAEGEKALYVYNRLLTVDTKELKENREALEEAAGALYEQEKALLKNEEAAAAAREKAAEYAQIWESNTKRVEQAFADAWKGSYDSFEEFTDRIKDSFKQMLGEMAHAAITKPFILNIQAALGNTLGVPGSAPASANAANSASSILNNASTLISNGLDFFNPSSGYITNTINDAATRMGYGVATEAAPGVTNSSTLIDPSSTLGQGLNALGAGFSAYGFAKKYGTAGGFAASTGTVALSGGLQALATSGSFMTGASAALSSIGPVGWAMMAIGAILGGKKPSDKTQWAGFTGADNELFSGGFEGKKFSQENRTGAEKMAMAANLFNQSLDHYSGREYRTSMQFQVGSRDGIFVRTSDDEYTDDLNRNESGTSASVRGGVDIYSGSDPKEAMNAAVKYMAEQHGVSLEIFETLANKGELLADAYMRLNQQQDFVRASLERLGLPFEQVGDDAIKLADELITAAGGLDVLSARSEYYYQNYYSEQERARFAMGEYTTSLDEFNKEFDQSISSSADLRAYVESLDLSTEAGQAAYVAALELAPALIELGKATQIATGDIAVSQLLKAWQTPDQRLADAELTLSDFNATLGLSGDDYIDTREEMKAHIESLDRDTEEGAEAAVYATSISGAVELVEDAATQTSQRVDQQLAAWQSPEERLQADQQRLQAFNDELGLSGEHFIDTREEMVAYLESLDQTTDAGRRAANSALLLSGAIERIEDSANAERSGTRSSLKSELERLIKEEEQSQKTLTDNLTAASKLYTDRLKQQQSEAEKIADQWTKAADALSRVHHELLASAFTPEQSTAVSRAKFDEALRGAWAGDINATEQLSGLAGNYNASLRNSARSGDEYRLNSARVAAQLDDARSAATGRAKSKMTEAEAAAEQVRLLEKQLADNLQQSDVLQSIERETLSMAEVAQEYYDAQREFQASDADDRADHYKDELESLEALGTEFAGMRAAQETAMQVEQTLLREITAGHQQLSTSLTNTLEALRETYPGPAAEAADEDLEKFANGGIASGPTSGYRVELHGTEAIIPLKGGAVPVSLDGGSVGSEIRALRADVVRLSDDLRRIGGEQIKASLKTAKTLSRWDVDGQPAQRRAS